MAITLATAAGEEHGLINTIPNRVPYDGFKHMNAENKIKMDKKRKEDNRIVKAEYINAKGHNERLTIPYCQYPGDPILQYNFIPGKKYEVPWGLVKKVNDPAGIMKKRSGLISLDGTPLKNDESPLDQDGSGDWIHRFVAPGFE